MRIKFHRNFEKQYQKLPKRFQEKTKQRLCLFMENPFHPLLDNHPLSGKYLDYRSINITGNLRAIFKSLSENECVFVELGTHSELYS